jgi:hypothetical protein
MSVKEREREKGLPFYVAALVKIKYLAELTA